MNSPGWSIDVKSCSDEQLGELHKQLQDSKYEGALNDIRRELIVRVRGRTKWNNQKIVDYLILGRPKKERTTLAKAWAEPMGITVQEFKKLMAWK